MKQTRIRSVLIPLVILAGCLVPGPSTAQMFSLWTDEGMTDCDVFLAGPYTPFSVYVFLDPGLEGAFAAEYKLTVLPGHFSPGGNVISPVVSGATIGVWYGSPGISAPFTSCQTELFWIVQLNMMSPNTDPGYYTVEPNDDTGFMGVAICPDPRPLKDAYLYNRFGFNADCVG